MLDSSSILVSITLIILLLKLNYVILISYLIFLEYFPPCNWPKGDEGAEELVGDSTFFLLRHGEAGGVTDPASDGGSALGLCLRDLGPELSDGVGGSPLLQAMEQNIDPRRGKKGRPSKEARHV